MTPDDLLGTWSVDARYGPGAIEDWLLHFHADGRGCLWYGNLMGAQVAVFDWRLTGGRLTTTTRRRFQTPSGHQEPFRPGGHVRLDLVEVPVTVEVEPTPARRQLRVLRLPRPGAPHPPATPALPAHAAWESSQLAAPAPPRPPTRTRFRANDPSVIRTRRTIAR